MTCADNGITGKNQEPSDIFEAGLQSPGRNPEPGEGFRTAAPIAGFIPAIRANTAAMRSAETGAQRNGL